MSPDPVVVVGSGASGVHFAQTALQLGRKVIMLDVGFSKPDPVRPEASLNELKESLDDPVEYFLGREFEAVVLPREGAEYYGFPPSKEYVFRGVDGGNVRPRGFSPLSSFATGGLAQAWTGGSYPLNDDELVGFPFGWEEMEPHYSEVARRIGISGMDDDLGRFFPTHDGMQDPLELDEHSRRLLDRYERKRSKLNGRLGCYMGRARLASLTRELHGRKPCAYLGRCLWGCPHEALYTPSVTLAWCRSRDEFEYHRGLRVDHFEFDDGGRVVQVVASEVESGATRRFEVGTLALAAGTLGTSRIVLESLNRVGEPRELTGLMDNRQVLMPFVNLEQIGRPFEPESYQYHQLAIGAPAPDPLDYVHGLVTTLKTAPIHPVTHSLPVGMRTATSLFRSIHSALGLVNINFRDWRRDENRISLDVDSKGRTTGLRVYYRPPADELARIRPTLSQFRRFLLHLRCIAPPNMTRVRPMGASVHYAGTVPLDESGGELTATPDGRCRPWENLYLVDGTTLPSLPAKNLTFTLMANATRVAEAAFT